MAVRVTMGLEEGARRAEEQWVSGRRAAAQQSRTLRTQQAASEHTQTKSNRDAMRCTKQKHSNEGEEESRECQTGRAVQQTGALQWWISQTNYLRARSSLRRSSIFVILF